MDFAFFKKTILIQIPTASHFFCAKGALGPSSTFWLSPTWCALLPFLPDTPTTTPLGSAARCGAAEDALNPFGCNAQRRLAQSSRAPPRLNSIQGAHRLPARLPHASPQLGAGGSGGWGWGWVGSFWGGQVAVWLWKVPMALGLTPFSPTERAAPPFPRGTPCLGTAVHPWS